LTDEKIDKLLRTKIKPRGFRIAITMWDTFSDGDRFEFRVNHQQF
jgi:hypothetical protein